MSSCTQTNGHPGTPTFSSGLTSQKALAASRCDQNRLLERLRVGAGTCCPGTPSTKTAIYSSILTQERATACQPSPLVQSLTFPRVGTTENIRIQKKMDALLTCSTDPLDNSSRYVLYRRQNPPAPCPPTPAEQLNSTTPKPTFFPGCTPTRYIR
jgi:hypothetical protein